MGATKGNQSQDQTSAKEVLTPEDLADFLGISVWTIYANTSRRCRGRSRIELPPFFRIGKLIRFSRRDLISWIDRQQKTELRKEERQ
jgi:predicted DNA-binding transcriptional regulator AlpA